jgi:hypothetical protein
VTLFSGTTSHGQVTIDTSGAVAVQLTGATASTTFAVQFCPFPSTRYQCFAVGSITSDGTGAAQTTFHFPKPGMWAGDFQLTSSGVAFSTQVGSNTGLVYFATLEPASLANSQGAGSTATGSGTNQDQGGGTLTVSNGTAHVVLTGAAPSTQYAVVQCFASDGSGCFQLGPFNANSFITDASGNVTFDVPAESIPGDFFTVEQAVTTPSTPMGLTAGFKVP